MDTIIETNDKNKAHDMTTPTESQQTIGLGVRLKSARESMNLTEKEAAARLYLNVNIITNIEKEFFLDGTPITFMRGYLRSYARLLNFPEDEIKSALDALGESTLSSPRSNTSILHSTPINKTDRYIHWITSLVIFTLIALVSIWWSSHSNYNILDVPKKTVNNPISTPAKPIPKPVVIAPINATPLNVPNEVTTDITSQPIPKDPNTSTPITLPLKEQSTSIPMTQPLVDKPQPTQVTNSTSPDTIKNQAAPKRKPHKNAGALVNMKIALPEPGLETNHHNNR